MDEDRFLLDEKMVYTVDEIASYIMNMFENKSLIDEDKIKELVKKNSVIYDNGEEEHDWSEDHDHDCYEYGCTGGTETINSAYFDFISVSFGSLYLTFIKISYSCMYGSNTYLHHIEDHNDVIYYIQKQQIDESNMEKDWINVKITNKVLNPIKLFDTIGSCKLKELTTNNQSLFLLDLKEHFNWDPIKNWLPYEYQNPEPGNILYAYLLGKHHGQMNTPLWTSILSCKDNIDSYDHNPSDYELYDYDPDKFTKAFLHHILLGIRKGLKRKKKIKTSWNMTTSQQCMEIVRAFNLSCL